MKKIAFYLAFIAIFSFFAKDLFAVLTGDNEDILLTVAAPNGETGLMGILIQKKTNLNHKNKKGKTALMLVASGKENPKLIGDYKGSARALLKAGARLDLVDNEGFDALYYSYKSRNLEVMKLLIAYGADANKRYGSYLDTVYDLAEREAKYSIENSAMFSMLKNGVDKNGRVKLLEKNKTKACENPEKIKLGIMSTRKTTVGMPADGYIIVEADVSCELYLLGEYSIEYEGKKTQNYDHEIVANVRRYMMINQKAPIKVETPAANFALKVKESHGKWKTGDFSYPGMYHYHFRAYECAQIEEIFKEPCAVVFPNSKNVKKIKNLIPHGELKFKIEVDNRP